MGLENTFKEKIENRDWRKPKKINGWESIFDSFLATLISKFEEIKGEDEWNFKKSEEYFNSCLEYFQNFDLTPKIIEEFCKKIGEVDEYLKWAFGSFVSAMIQKSYNSGYNNFKLSDLKIDMFGSFLEGKDDDKIRIKIDHLIGDWNFWRVKNIYLKTSRILGDWNFWKVENVKLEIPRIDGMWNFLFIENSNFEIGKAVGKENFWYIYNSDFFVEDVDGIGNFWHIENSIIKVNRFYNGVATNPNFYRGIKNSIIKSKNQYTLSKIKKNISDGSSNEDNKFIEEK